jgi:hypothetical protein
MLNPRSILAAVLGCGILMGTAAAQVGPADRSGVKHIITAAVSVASAQPSGQIGAQTGRQAEQRITGLRVTVRISDHAQETQFFGEVPVSLPDFAVSEGAPDRKVWEDAKCHQRRGLPKASVAAIEGTLEGGQSPLAISARPRHIGMRVPADEVRQALPLPEGRDELGRFFAFRTETMQSHVAVVLKIHMADCTL